MVVIVIKCDTICFEDDKIRVCSRYTQIVKTTLLLLQDDNDDDDNDEKDDDGICLTLD